MQKKVLVQSLVVASKSHRLLLGQTAIQLDLSCQTKPPELRSNLGNICASETQDATLLRCVDGVLELAHSMPFACSLKWSILMH